MTRRSFLRSAALVALAGSGAQPLWAQQPAPYDVCEKTIAQLQAAMAAGTITSEQLVELYLRRIRAYDQAGPHLNAVLFVSPEAAAVARALDRERRQRGPRGPLHGIPALLKDNFDTSDMPTTGGSLALAGVVPRTDAHQVRRLRDAGVVILGKVNLHELALGLTTVSSLGGQTLNPYDLRRAPGGSSGGSGVAAAANFAAFTLGTDTSGSIRIPSSHNCLVGLRPTAGLSSRAGIIPFGHTQDTGGPMARTVADVAVVLDATAGFDVADAVTAASKGRIPATYTSGLLTNALNGARIGVLRELFGAAPEDEPVGSLIRRAIDDMTARGATAVDVAIGGLNQQLAASNLLTQELKFDLRDYLGRSSHARIKSAEELLASGLHTAQFQAFVEGANALPDDYPGGADYLARLAARETLGRAVVDTMDKARVDVLVYPTTRRIAPVLGGNQAGSNAALSAQSGLPALTVPAGFTAGGFPVGIEMLGRPFAEARLLALAYAYECAANHRRPPATTPPLSAASPVSRAVEASSDRGPNRVAFEVTATGKQATPPSTVPFQARVRFTFNGESGQLGYEVRITGNARDVLGVYLHRRANRPNGGVAYILVKGAVSLRPSTMLGAALSAVEGRDPALLTGRVTLTEAEVADLRAGKLYVSAVSRSDVRRSARADLVLGT
jgi:amidase